MKKIIFLSVSLIFLCSAVMYGQVSISITSVTNATCNGINNGSIITTASNGTGPYTYSWSPSGGTDSSATNLAPGNYTVTVTDATLSTATATATVNEISPVIITTDGISDYLGYNVSCSGGNNGWINTTGSGGPMVGADSVEFVFTGAEQIFVVPAGITQVIIRTWGAQGGANWVNNTNFGGYAHGNLSVIPGETLYVYVGEQPTVGIAGGFNGGGNGDGAGKGGGGASDVRQGGNTLNDRKIVGAGGGGGGYWSSLHVVGGIGGGLTGGNGYREPDYVSNPGGLGAGQTGPGASGTCISFNVPAMSGGFGYGGTPLGSSCGCEGYGGGAGWYGGAGSGNCRGAGGGSSYIDGVTSGYTVGGVNPGNGKVTIAYNAPDVITYSWSHGPTIDDVTNLTAGTYTLTATASITGCLTTETFTITEPSTVDATLDASNISCIGANDGVITTSASGGVPGYTYLWLHDGSTNASVNGLSVGTYVVNVTDAAGCSIYDSTSIVEPAPFDINFNASNALCFDGNQGSITAIPSGGTPPYTYLWSPNSETTASISGLTAGVYILAITDTNGCTFTDSVSISEPTAIMLSSTTVNETIGNDGSINLTVSGGVTTYSFLWSNGATTEDVTGLAGGTYSVTVTDGNGCTETATIIVGSTFGIMENASGDLSIYPNPSDGLFYVLPENNLSGEYQMSVMDLNGKIIYTSTGYINDQPILIDASLWSAGTYNLRFTTTSSSLVKRIVIK